MKSLQIKRLIIPILLFTVVNCSWASSTSGMSELSQVSVASTYSEQNSMKELYNNPFSADVNGTNSQSRMLRVPPPGGGDPQKVVPVENGIGFIFLACLVYGLAKRRRFALLYNSKEVEKF